MEFPTADVWRRAKPDPARAVARTSIFQQRQQRMDRGRKQCAQFANAPSRTVQVFWDFRKGP